MQTISASEFKAKCLALLDDVAESGGEIVVTKRGRPVAKLGPIDEVSAPDLRGSVTYLVSEEEFLAPIEDWDAEAD